MNIKEIFLNEIVPNAHKGRIKIIQINPYLGEEEFFYNIKYCSNLDNSKDIDNQVPYLKVNNSNLFFKLLEDYVYLTLEKYEKPSDITNDEYIKKILTLAFNNATYNDFLYPEEYLKTRINFLKENYEDSEKNLCSNVKLLNNSSIYYRITKQSLMLETPYKCQFRISDENNNYFSPSISFGISDGCCYIYALQNHKSETNNYLESINQIIKENLKNDYIINKENLSPYFKKSMRNVSPNFIFFLYLFILKLKQMGVEKIKIIPFLPVRYYGKEKSNEFKANVLGKNEEEKKDILIKLNNEQKKIQLNLTNKFVNNIQKLECLTKMVDCDFEEMLYIGGWANLKIKDNTFILSPLLKELNEISLVQEKNLSNLGK